MNSQQPLHQFKVILNPKRFYIFGAKKTILLIFDEYLILKKRRNPLRIPYASIKSLWLNKGKAFLTWGDETLSFGIASYISPSTFDVSLTTQAVYLILLHKSGGAISPEAYPELTLKNVAADKRKLFIKVVITVMAFAIIATILFGTLWSRSPLLVLAFICCMVVFYAFVIRLGPVKRHNQRGLFCVSIGWTDRAIEEFKEALRVSANNLDVRFNLAMTYFFKKDLLSAQVECQKILELNPDNEPAKKLLDMIDAHSSP